MPVDTDASQALVANLTGPMPSGSTIRDLLIQGADPNACDPEGLPILVVACVRGMALTVEGLLAAGADPLLGAAGEPGTILDQLPQGKRLVRAVGRLVRLRVRRGPSGEASASLQ